MKVKVTHTLELNEVPAKVVELVSGIRARFARLASMPVNTTNLESFSNAVQVVRMELAICDSQLEDALNMQEGYENVMQQMTDTAAQLQPTAPGHVQPEGEDEKV